MPTNIQQALPEQWRSHLADEFDKDYMHYVKCGGYDGPFPVVFQPSTGDKLIFKELAEHVMSLGEIKEFLPRNVRGDAIKILFLLYYPEYDFFNRIKVPE